MASGCLHLPSMRRYHAALVLPTGLCSSIRQGSVMRGRRTRSEKPVNSRAEGGRHLREFWRNKRSAPPSPPIDEPPTLARKH